MDVDLTYSARLVLGFEDLHTLGIRYSRAQLYRLIRAGKFPMPIKLSANRTVWRRQEIVDFINAIEPGIGPSIIARRKHKALAGGKARPAREVS